jgi:error-prone DNA polymerase
VKSPIWSREIADLSELLRSVGEREQAFPLAHGRSDQVTHTSARDPREALDRKPGDIYVRDSSSGRGIEVSTRDFR